MLQYRALHIYTIVQKKFLLAVFSYCYWRFTLVSPKIRTLNIYTDGFLKETATANQSTLRVFLRMPRV
jgi:hypothetical protein